MGKILATRLLLVRHGETEWNRLGRFQGKSDIPLNQKGQEEARVIALTLKEEPVIAIYTSPLARAKETAYQIKSYHSTASLYEEKGLQEMDLGNFEGMKASMWADQYPELLRIWQTAPASVTMPGGESLPDVQQRAVETVKQITEVYPPGSTLVICSHNFVIVSLLCYAMALSLDQFHRVKQETGTCAVIRVDNNQMEVETTGNES